MKPLLFGVDYCSITLANVIDLEFGTERDDFITRENTKQKQKQTLKDIVALAYPVSE